MTCDHFTGSAVNFAHELRVKRNHVRLQLLQDAVHLHCASSCSPHTTQKHKQEHLSLAPLLAALVGVGFERIKIRFS